MNITSGSFFVSSELLGGNIFKVCINLNCKFCLIKVIALVKYTVIIWQDFKLLLNGSFLTISISLGLPPNSSYTEQIFVLLIIYHTL